MGENGEWNVLGNDYGRYERAYICGLFVKEYTR